MLLAPYSSKKRDPNPQRSAFLSRLPYRIDTVFSQLTERYSIKRVWARDVWHLASRLVRKVLSLTPLLSCSTTNLATDPFSSRSCSSEKLAHRVSYSPTARGMRYAPPRQAADLWGVDVVIPSTKAPALERELFLAELMAGVAERVAALGRGRDSHAGSIDELAEAVTVLQNRPSGAKPKAKAPKAKAAE